MRGKCIKKVQQIIECSTKMFSNALKWQQKPETHKKMTSTPLVTLKKQFLKQNPKIHRNCGMQFVHPWLKYRFLGARSWLTRCNADAQKLSKTMVM